jgi:CxxC-x17-CxxC domain-containing protein
MNARTGQEITDHRVAGHPYPVQMGEGAMQFVDRFLKCSDCNNEFVFTAGEQLFFNDKLFKHDPKRCKLCKAKRAGLGRSAANPSGAATLPFSRTETRTECSACGIATTVPFKPTQGRPVLCRSCFQMKRVPSGVVAAVNMDSPTAQVAAAMDESFGTGTTVVLPPSSSAATMEMIAETPRHLMADGDAMGERSVGSAEVSQA